MSVAVLVPVLDRPHNVSPLLDTIFETTPDPYVLFLTSPGDRAEIAAIDKDGRAGNLRQTGNYAKKINAGIRATAEPLIFLAADDLRFRPGWFEAAAEQLDPAQVVGVNDLIPRKHRPEHATHFLVTRTYAEERGCIDAKGLLCEEYRHNFVDDELIATATHHGLYAYAPDAQVQHLHPTVGAPMDATYRRGMGRMAADRKIFYRRRRRLWT